MKRNYLVSIILPLSALLVATLACGTDKANPPTVTVVAPPNGAQVAVGQTVEVQFRAEGDDPVSWVQMTVNGDVVATQQSPLPEGQTPLEGILRWTPNAAGTFNLILTAHDTASQESAPAAVSITVTEAAADAPTPTLMPTPASQQPAPTKPPTQPTQSSTQPTKPSTQPTNTPPQSQPTATTKPPSPPTPTATTKPPSAPTPTPTSSPTSVPPPEIVSFTVDDNSIDAGDTVIISWETRNVAGGVFLDGVQVDASSSVFDQPTADVTYRLVAKGATGANPAEVTREVSVQVTLVIPETTIGAPYVPGMSGSVSGDGNVLGTVYPGDDINDTDYEGFLTFDIRSLPANGTITSAYLNLGPCDINGDPSSLGDLHVVNLQYDDLDAGDYSAGGAYIASVDPCTIFSIDVTDRVEAMKAEVYFQIRLYFDGSNIDGQLDDVTYTTPTLDITYIIQ
jgi:hypothetical protein